MSFETPKFNEGVLAKEPPPPPMYGVDQKKKRPGNKSMAPTFLGAEAVPTAPQMGNKTLLGQ